MLWPLSRPLQVQNGVWPLESDMWWFFQSTRLPRDLCGPTGTTKVPGLRNEFSINNNIHCFAKYCKWARWCQRAKACQTVFLNCVGLPICIVESGDDVERLDQTCLPASAMGIPWVKTRSTIMALMSFGMTVTEAEAPTLYLKCRLFICLPLSRVPLSLPDEECMPPFMCHLWLSDHFRTLAILHL